MSNNNNRKFKDLISENFLREISIFLLLFVLVIAQDWKNILLLLFPLISFGFYLFFKTMNLMRIKENVENDSIVYHPIGSEKISSQRLFFCAVVQITLLFWFGAESLYHPQLIDNYSVYFVSIFIFFYTFSFYWVLIDCWKYSRIEIAVNSEELKYSKKISENLERVISFLKMKNFKIIFIINLLVFIILNLINFILAILTFNNYITGIIYKLPGTGIENSDPIILPYSVYAVLIISPVNLGISLIQIYKDINDLDKNKLNKILSSLPRAAQNKIIRKLNQMNEKYKIKLKLE